MAIGVEVNTTKHEVQPVDNDGLPQIGRLQISNSTAKEILTHKLEVWSYEEEVRVFTNGTIYVEVEVKEILLGRNMATQDKSFVKKLVGSINENIEVKNAPNKYA